MQTLSPSSCEMPALALADPLGMLLKKWRKLFHDEEYFLLPRPLLRI